MFRPRNCCSSRISKRNSMRRRRRVCGPASLCVRRMPRFQARGTKPPWISAKWRRNSTFPMDRVSTAEVAGPSPSQQAKGRGPVAWLRARPLVRAFLWGLASALALPPVHLLPVLLFSIPAFLTLIDEAKSKKQLMLPAWMFGFGLNLAGLYWITEPVLTEAARFWWLVPFAAPLLAV